MRWIFGIILAVVVAWAAGFVVFLQSLGAAQHDARPCEAIVVLTGGAGRIDHGFHLLETKRAERLFITGVGEHNNPDLFVQRYGLSEALQQKIAEPEVLTIDRTADSTYSNADQTQLWLKDQLFEAVCLVTSAYHMPRSLLVFRDAMPEQLWIAEPVFTDGFALESWWEDEMTRRVLFTEYHKLIAAWLLAHVR